MIHDPLAGLDLEPMAAEQRRHNRRLERSGASVPPPGAVPTEIIRRNRIEGLHGLPKPIRLSMGTDEEIPGPSGPIPVRVFVPSKVSAVYLHFHGGGWVFGSIWEQDERLWSIAERAGVAVVTVGYRLAPEHPFPAAIDDAVSAVRWFARDAPTRFGTSRLLLGGESAGAHLAVTALLRTSTDGSRPEVIGAHLNYGIYDLGMTEGQRDWGDRSLGISTPWLEWFYDAVTPDLTADQRRSPDVSPMYAPLPERLPAVLFTVGTADPLFEDSVLMANRWHAAGGTTYLAIYPEGPHGVNVMPTSIGRLANDTIERFLARCSNGLVDTVGKVSS